MKSGKVAFEKRRKKIQGVTEALDREVIQKLPSEDQEKEHGQRIMSNYI